MLTLSIRRELVYTMCIGKRERERERERGRDEKGRKGEGGEKERKL